MVGKPKRIQVPMNSDVSLFKMGKIVNFVISSYVTGDFDVFVNYPTLLVVEEGPSLSLVTLNNGTKSVTD